MHTRSYFSLLCEHSGSSAISGETALLARTEPEHSPEREHRQDPGETVGKSGIRELEVVC